MKRIKKYLALIAIVLVEVMCVTLVGVEHPETATVNSPIDVKLDLEVAPAEDGQNNILVSILAPLDWNVDQTATITFTTSKGDGPISLHPAPATEMDTWAATLRGAWGDMENYEPVKWVTFISDQQISWQNNTGFSGTVNISYNTGRSNIIANLGYIVTTIVNYTDPDITKIHRQKFETTGGEGPTVDYTIPKVLSITPETFTWEDIVAIHCNQTAEDAPLAGAFNVYMMAKATYGNGHEKVIDAASSKNRMMTERENVWMLYIYPHEFFEIPASETITEISFWFTNEDGSIVSAMPDDSGFILPENNK